MLEIMFESIQRHSLNLRFIGFEETAEKKNTKIFIQLAFFSDHNWNGQLGH